MLNFLRFFVPLHANIKNLMGRILAIDFGRKRTGIAVTDPLRMIANSLELANNALPPKINTLKTYGYLDIIPTALIFANNFTQNVALKINFWGIITPFYFQIGSALHFDIVAPNSIFKQYLIDTRISTVEVVDTRNYKCIAYTIQCKRTSI